jgi:2-polyprenyl-6-methoxyphenol hydroxylase-like FAD-dependent oxidoreductase
MALNTAPYEWTIWALIKHIKEGPQAQVKGGDWEPARPYGLYSLRNRFRLAWMVFTGEADALRWPFQKPKAY